MTKTPSFLEDHISQIPALQLLQNLGYTYLTPQEALKERQDKTSNVILEGILEKQLKKINKITFKGEQCDFSENNIKAAIHALKEVLYDGLIQTNENVYDLLTLGKSFEEDRGGDKKSPQLQYIDWKNPQNNVYHVTEEFEVYNDKSKAAKANIEEFDDSEEAENKKPRRPDIVLFVNGIPFVIIECKRPDIKNPIKQAISQQIRNQKDDYIPRLFVFSQILIAINKNEAKYATTGTPNKFWSSWQEKTSYQDKLRKLINTKLSEEKKNKLFKDRFAYVKNYFDELENEGERLISEQDILLYSLCEPTRLLELVYQFIVFDAGVKKIARYQQYFAVKNTLAKIKRYSTEGKREGGVIWHTQGSGKSLTMVMLAKAIALDPSIIDPKVIIVTDRVDLDRQIWKTFRHCGKEPVRATSGEDLIKKIEDKKEIITTLVHKFDAALKKRKFSVDSNNIFILVDESHRSQYGLASAKMEMIFPKACYIGFTGTPLMKKDKNTAVKYGGIIDKYTIDEAVKDEAVVPLLYENRYTLQNVTEQTIDNWFEMICKPLTEKQRQDLKRKFSTERVLNEADQKIAMVAYDISQHYKNNWKDTGFKAQLTTPKKKIAIKFKEYLDQFGEVSSEVLISAPDCREGHEDVHEEISDEVQKFWKSMMKKHGNEKKYNENVIEAFQNKNNPEIIIVVDKLLTGFDEPKNTVLYIAQSLKEHTLLQAIARVNRLCEGKDFGYIIDYYGLLGELDEALTLYTEAGLKDFEDDDLAGTLVNVAEEIAKLPQTHSILLDLFKNISNKMDVEAYEQFLNTQELRDKFYQRLSIFVRTLKIALSSYKFLEETSEDKIKKYQEDAKFFLKLRTSVKARYAESIDYKEYEPKVQKLIDTYITSDEIIQVTEPVNIFDAEKFDAEVEKRYGEASKADTIAYRLDRTIREKMEEDPVFYEKFSKLLKDAIQKHKEKILSDLDYLNKVKEYLKSVRTRTGDDLPERIKHREVARAFYGIVNQIFEKFNCKTFDAKEISTDVGIKIDDIIFNKKIVDWTKNPDIQKEMLNEIEDYLYSLKGRCNIDLSFDDIDTILEKTMPIAQKWYSND